MNFPLPELGEGVYEAEVVQWLVRAGQSVTPGLPLLQVLTDKATMEVPSPFAGTIATLLTEPGRKVRIGEPVLEYEPVGVIPPPAAVPVETRTTKLETPIADQPAAAPSIRHLARKFGLDLASIRGTGPGGRILLDDIAPLLGPPSESRAAPPPAPPFDLGVAGTRVKLAGIRRVIAEHMVRSKQTIPHYSYMDECEITEMVRLRESLREPLADRGIKLTYLAFFIKAVASALKQVPLVNSSLDDAAGEIVMHDRYHVGFAVATPRGLIVPVVRDADRKDVFAIAREVERLSEAARSGAVKADELRDGTFTVTSIGGIGGLIATPIIHAPQVGILGLGKVVKRPVYDDKGELRPAEMIYLSMSFDHRVVDGAIGAVFGNAVMRGVRNPAALMLPV